VSISIDTLNDTVSYWVSLETIYMRETRGVVPAGLRMRGEKAQVEAG
jgi:hypothetical protein